MIQYLGICSFSNSELLQIFSTMCVYFDTTSHCRFWLLACLCNDCIGIHKIVSFKLSRSCFSEVHSGPGPSYSSPQAIASSSGGVVCGLSPSISQRQGSTQAVPTPCQNPYPLPPPLSLLRHNHPCQSHHHHQPVPQPHIKPEHCAHYTAGWVSEQANERASKQKRKIASEI